MAAPEALPIPRPQQGFLPHICRSQNKRFFIAPNPPNGEKICRALFFGPWPKGLPGPSDLIFIPLFTTTPGSVFKIFK
jgi:hypothetical protein